MLNKTLLNIFDKGKELFWNYTHKDPSRMLIAMAAFGFALSSMAQCFAIDINNKIDKKKKRFMLAQETADGIINIGLFLGITSSIWKVSDKLIRFLGIKLKNCNKIIKLSQNKNNHLKDGGRIATTMLASVAACNIITPFARNYIAAKIRNHFDIKEENNKNVYPKFIIDDTKSPFNKYNEQLKFYKNNNTPNSKYYTFYNGSLKI